MFMGVAIVKEMLQRVNSDKPGPFQLMMANQLETMGANTKAKDLFSSWRLAACFNFRVRNIFPMT